MNAMQDAANRLAVNGWEGLEFQPNATPEQFKAMFQQRKLDEAGPVAALFETPEGRRVLDWLITKTLMRPPGDFELAAQTAEQYAINKAKREGQNSIVLIILEAIQVVRDANSKRVQA